MKRSYFLELEHYDPTLPIELEEVIAQLAFNEQGLIPVITQDATSKEVLMFAWMNKESVKKTLATKQMTYWSRSRQRLWEQQQNAVKAKKSWLRMKSIITEAKVRNDFTTNSRNL